MNFTKGKSMNRILVVGCPPGVNGIMTCVCNLLKNIDRTVFEWEFLIPKVELYSEARLEPLKKLNVRIHSLNFYRSGFPRSARKHLKELMMDIPDLCGVHVHDTGRLNNVYPLYLANQLKLPIKVIQVHANSKSCYPSTFPSERALSARRRMISGDDFIRLACSRRSGHSAYNNLPFSVFPNATDLDRFSYNPIYRKIIRDKLNIPENGTVIGFPGNFSQVKNPIFAVEVFGAFHKMHPDSHMILLGDGPLQNEAKHICDKTELRDFTHFTGNQSDVELFLSAMDLILCTSFTEGLPNALIEAQATGLPALISDAVTDEIHVTDLTESCSLDSSPDFWANKISEMLHKETPRRSYKNELSNMGYDIKDTATLLQSLYMQCLQPNNVNQVTCCS